MQPPHGLVLTKVLQMVNYAAFKRMLIELFIGYIMQLISTMENTGSASWVKNRKKDAIICTSITSQPI